MSNSSKKSSGIVHRSELPAAAVEKMPVKRFVEIRQPRIEATLADRSPREQQYLLGEIERNSQKKGS